METLRRTISLFVVAMSYFLKALAFATIVCSVIMCAGDSVEVDVRELERRLIELDTMMADSTDSLPSFLCVDAGYSRDSRSIFIIRSYYLTDTFYMYWALARASDTLTTWPFGGPWWGDVGGKYKRLLERDSLFLLFGYGNNWSFDSIWDLAVSDLAAGYLPIKAIQEKDGALKLETIEVNGEQ